MHASISSLLDGNRTCPAHAENGRWHTLLIEPVVQLSDHTSAARQTIGSLKNIPGSIDIGRTGTHSTINLDATSTRNATTFDEINNWLDTNGNDHHFTGDMCSLRSHNACNLPLFT